MALLEEHGPGALSMRRLADRLGVAPTALYTHIRGKADLVDGLIEVYAGLDLDLGPDPAGDWTEELAAIAQEVRAHLLAHPAEVPLALQQPGLGPNSLRLGEAIYRVLRAAGFPDQTVVGAVYTLLTYILGFVALEIPRAGTDPQTSDEFVRRLHGFFAALPRASSPTPSSSPRCWPASPPTTSTGSASACSSPASGPGSRNPRPDGDRGGRLRRRQPARNRATRAPIRLGSSYQTRCPAPSTTSSSPRGMPPTNRRQSSTEPTGSAVPYTMRVGCPMAAVSGPASTTPLA
jgi:TetR/AcrR family transcriptional regulator, tetracycline repressor protein